MFSDYTLRVLMFLAMHETRLVTIDEIAEAYGISANHLVKVVHQLARQGLVESVRGKGGGLRLGRPAEAIRIGEVTRQSEGAAPIVECLSDGTVACRIAPVCKLKGVLVDAFETFYQALDQHTLADLVSRPKPLLAALGARR